MNDTALSTNDDRFIQAMQLLGDETRYKMFKVLLEGQSPCVSEISAMLGVSVSAVSQQFKMFELSGLVKRNRHGQKICYQLSLNDPVIASLAQLIKT